MGIIHYRYATAIVTALLVGALAVKWYDIPHLAELLSFGLTLSSLILAIIAIIQALVSSTAFSGTVATITSSIEQVRAAATQIGQASSQLLLHAETIPSALSQMAQHLDQALNKQSAALPSRAGSALGPTSPTSAATADLLSRASNGTIMAYYFCVLSHERSKSFDPPKMFPASPIIGLYLQGCVAALRSAGTMNIEFTNTTFIVSDLKSVDPALIKALVNDNINIDYIRDTKIVADAYFTQ